MQRRLNKLIATLPKSRRQGIEARAMELASLKGLRQATHQTPKPVSTKLKSRAMVLSKKADS